MKLALVNILDISEVSPMGLAYIATYLREHMGSHSYVENPLLLDDSVDKAEFKRLFEEAKQRIYVYFERRYWHYSIGWMLKQSITNPKRGLEVLLKILKLKTGFKG